jgi:hypothetical protein
LDGHDAVDWVVTMRGIGKKKEVPMLTQKLLAVLGLASALLLGATTDASANPWRGHRGPVYRPAPVVVAPVYRPVYRPAPVVVAPVYQAPVYVSAPRVVVYQALVYAPPVYRPLGWRHPHWHHGRRW